MRRSLRTLVPLATALSCGLVVLVAPSTSATAAPSPDKNVPVATPAGAAAPSAKFPALPADKAVTGYQQVVSDPLTDTAGAQVAGSVSCPRGSKVVGGGAIISGSSTAENLNGSLPLTDNRTWRVYVNNASGTDGSFRVYATCATKIPSYSIVTGTGVGNPAGNQTSTTVTCPSGTVPLGGGGLGSSTSTAVNLNSSLPTTTGWRVDVDNASTGGDTATAYAVCGAAPVGYRQVAGTSTANPAGSQNLGTASCRSNPVVLSGGVFSGSASTAVSVNSSFPSSRSAWTAYENNASTGNASFATSAICGRPATT